MEKGEGHFLFSSEQTAGLGSWVKGEERDRKAANTEGKERVLEISCALREREMWKLGEMMPGLSCFACLRETVIAYFL